MMELTVFDADEIQTQLDRDLAAGLRMLADALDQGQIEGRLIRAQGVAGAWIDPRAHVLVSIDIAAQVLTLRKGPQLVELPEKVGA